MRYEVQHYTLAYGWINTWSYAESDGVLHAETFTTDDEAEAALDEFFTDLEEEVAAGNIASCDRDQYRVRRVTGTATAAQPVVAGAAP
jgi:hypothetical protein